LLKYWQKSNQQD